MNNWKVRIVSSGDNLPEGLLEDSFFHSSVLYQLFRSTPRHTPYMVIVEDNEKIISQMLAVVRYRSSWLPPYFYSQCRILSEGVYRLSDEDTQVKEELFGIMLSALRSRLGHRVFFFEISNLSQKMFGYAELKHNDFFAVKWMSIHNSLHSRQPEERVSERLLKRMSFAKNRGVKVSEVKTEADLKAFTRLLRHHHWLKPQRYLPPNEFFRGIPATGNGRLFITRFHEHVIGCSALVYSSGQAYLWYSAFRRKSFVRLHPDEMTIWHAIKDSYNRGFQHIFFMNVGLPFRRSNFRDFILRFGGKPASTYRWFHVNIGWVNRLLSWIYRA